MKTEFQSHSLEAQLQRVAKAMQYPATPNIQLPARPVRSSALKLRPAFLIAVLVAIAVVASLLSWRPVRAALIEILQVGGIEIHISEDTKPTATQTFRDTFTLAGETSLAEAQRTVIYPLRYPSALGEPDSVYLQDWGEHLIIMVWWADDGTIEVALYQWRGNGMVHKSAPDAEFILVNDDYGIWIERPHDLWFMSANGLREEEVYLVKNPVLIWERGLVTYRLETHLTMSETVELAETLIEYER